MSQAASPTAAPLARLAKRLERDIVSRGLAPGDRYLTAAEAARTLGVSTATANRAMRLLAARKILDRERSRGTFVGTGAKPQRRCDVRTVFVLQRDIEREQAGRLYQDMLSAIGAHFERVNVQFGFVPPAEPVAYVQEMLAPVLEAGHLAGVVAISCPREVYCYLDGLGVPLVIMGSLYPDERPIPSVDADNRTAGRLLTRYLIDRGHHRMALLCSSGSHPGDHDFQDGACEMLAEAGLPATALLVRTYPPGADALRALLKHMLAMEEPPSAFLCRGQHYIDIIARMLGELKQPRGPLPEIVFDDYSTRASERLPYARVVRQMDLGQTTRLVGKMLQRLSRGEELDQEKIVIPVELRQPDSQ